MDMSVPALLVPWKYVCGTETICVPHATYNAYGGPEGSLQSQTTSKCSAVDRIVSL